MSPHTATEHARLFCADLNQWPSVLSPGSVVLSHIDGPYNMGKAAWDSLTGAQKTRQPLSDPNAERIVGRYLEVLADVDPDMADLVAWYAPVLESITRASAASASAYLWNTDAGEAALRPVMQALGWRLLSRIVWNKQMGMAMINPRIIWGSITESLGVYTRGVPVGVKVEPLCNVWTMAPPHFQNERFRGARIKSGRYSTDSLNPCQKPIAFADRVLRASSSPGDLVVDWFGGTCRLAVANARLPRDERRQVVSFELDATYLDAVAPSLTFCPAARGNQPSLFGGVA